MRLAVLLITFFILIVTSSIAYAIDYTQRWEGSTMYNDDGLAYEYTPLGAQRVWSYETVGANKLIGAQAYMVSGEVLGSPMKRYSWDWTWGWGVGTQQVPRIEYFPTYNLTYNVTQWGVVGHNNYTPFYWIQKWTFEPLRDAKEEHIFYNGLVEVENFKFWQLHYIDNITAIRYSNQTYHMSEILENGDVYLSGNLSNILSRATISNTDSYTFRYNDLLELGWDVTDVYIGNASWLGFPDELVFALGFQRGRDPTFRFGEIISLDPATTGYKFPSRGTSVDWQNPENIIASDNQRAMATAVQMATPLYGVEFGFTSQTLTEVDGIRVHVEGNAKTGLCGVGAGVNISVSLSWDNGLNYTETKYAWFPCSGKGDISKYVGGETDTWGRTWSNDEFNNSNFKVKITGSGVSGGDMNQAGEGIDAESVNIYYDNADVIINLDSPLHEEGIASSSVSLNFTLDDPEDQSMDFKIKGSNYSCYPNHKCGATGEYIYYVSPTSVSDGSFNKTWDSLPQGLYYWTVNATDDTGTYGTIVRQFQVVNESVPYALNDYPANGSTVTTSYTTLNTTITDDMDDYMSAIIYSSNDTSNLKEKILYQDKWIKGRTILYNYTSIPLSSDLDSLKVLYHMDYNPNYDENNTHVMDFAGQDNNGSVLSGYSTDIIPHNYSGGYYGGGFKFGKNARRINIDDFAELDSNSLSFYIWVKIYGEGNSNDDIFDRANTFPAKEGYRLEVAYNNNSVVWYNASHRIGSNANIFTENVWTNIIVTVNDTHVNFYKNGTAWGSYEGDYGFQPGDEDLRVGLSGLLAVSGGLNGTIDEFALWNRTLSDTEISGFFTLTDGEYYWNTSVTDGLYKSYNFSQFTIGEEVTTCSYECSGQAISSPLDCSGNPLILNGAGSIVFSTEVTADRLAVTGGCLAGFLDRLNVIN